MPLQLAFYDPNQEIEIIEDGVEHKKFGHELDAKARIQYECDVSLEFVRLYNILVNDSWHHNNRVTAPNFSSNGSEKNTKVEIK